MATKTIGDLKKSVHFRLANTRVVDDRMDTPIQEAIGSALSEIVHEVDAAAYRKQREIEIYPNVKIVELPEDYHKIIDPGVVIDGVTLVWFNQQDYDSVNSSSRVRTGTPCHYTIGGRDVRTGRYKLHLYPVPDATLDMRIHYFAKPQQIWSASDTDQLDQRFDGEWVNAIECRAALGFTQYLTQDQIQGYSAEYAKALHQIKKDNRPVAGVGDRQRHYDSRPRSAGFEHRTLDGPLDYVDGSGSLRG